MKPASHPLRNALCWGAQVGSPGQAERAAKEWPWSSASSLNVCLNNPQRGSSLLNTKPDVHGHWASLAPNSDFIQCPCSCHSQFLSGHSPTRTLPRAIMNFYSSHTKAEWEGRCLFFLLSLTLSGSWGSRDSRLFGFKFFPWALVVLCFVAGQCVGKALWSATEQAIVLIAMRPL